MKTISLLFPILSIMLLFSACETSTNSSPAVTLTKGMSIEQINMEMGEPMEVVPTDIYKGKGEAWIYKKIRTTTSQTASHTIDVLYIDPITGEEKIIKQPVAELQSTKHKFLTTLYVLDGKLIGWKQSTTTSNSIGN